MCRSAYTSVCIGLVSLCSIPSGEALAQDRTYRVTIDTEPEGATVWVDDRAGEAAGTTPHTDRLSAGRHTVFLQLEGYEIAVKEITVENKRKGKQRFEFELIEQSVGSIDVLAAEGADASEGAKVYIDGDQVGTIPDSFEAPEGAHQLQVSKDGYKPYESWVEVKKGESIEVNVALDKLTARDGDGDGDIATDISRHTDTDTSETGPLVRFRAGMGAGWRRFAYRNRATNNLRPYAANGLALVDISAELHAGELVSALSVLSIFGNVDLSLPVDSQVEDTEISLTTSWLRREVGLRARFSAGPGHLGVDVAEAGNAFTFDNAGVLADEIAQAEYEYLRVGSFYGVESPTMSAGAGADALIVLSSKGVSERFPGSSIYGGRVHSWYRRHLFSGVEGSISASLTYLRYSLQSNATYAADGGYDLMIDVIGGAGYRF